MVGFISKMLVTNPEIDKMKNLFLEIDQDHDGYISLGEFQKGLSLIVGSLEAQSQDIKELM